MELPSEGVCAAWLAGGSWRGQHGMKCLSVPQPPCAAAGDIPGPAILRHGHRRVRTGLLRPQLSPAMLQQSTRGPKHMVLSPQPFPLPHQSTSPCKVLLQHSSKPAPSSPQYPWKQGGFCSLCLVFPTSREPGWVKTHIVQCNISARSGHEHS